MCVASAELVKSGLKLPLPNDVIKRDGSNHHEGKIRDGCWSLSHVVADQQRSRDKTRQGPGLG